MYMCTCTKGDYIKWFGNCLLMSIKTNYRYGPSRWPSYSTPRYICLTKKRIWNFMVGLCITSQNESIPMFIKSKMNKLDYSLTMEYYATMKKTITTTCNTTTNIEVRHKKNYILNYSIFMKFKSRENWSTW